MARSLNIPPAWQGPVIAQTSELSCLNLLSQSAVWVHHDDDLWPVPWGVGISSIERPQLLTHYETHCRYRDEARPKKSIYIVQSSWQLNTKCYKQNVWFGEWNIMWLSGSKRGDRVTGSYCQKIIAKLISGGGGNVLLAGGTSPLSSSPSPSPYETLLKVTVAQCPVLKHPIISHLFTYIDILWKS